MLKRYCAWHQKYFGTELFIGEVPSERDEIVNDGICEDCKKLFEKEAGAYFGDTQPTNNQGARPPTAG